MKIATLADFCPARVLLAKGAPRMMIHALRQRFLLCEGRLEGSFFGIRANRAAVARVGRTAVIGLRALEWMPAIFAAALALALLVATAALISCAKALPSARFSFATANVGASACYLAVGNHFVVARFNFSGYAVVQLL